MIGSLFHWCQSILIQLLWEWFSFSMESCFPMVGSCHQNFYHTMNNSIAYLVHLHHWADAHYHKIHCTMLCSFLWQLLLLLLCSFCRSRNERQRCTQRCHVTFYLSPSNLLKRQKLPPLNRGAHKGCQEMSWDILLKPLHLLKRRKLPTWVKLPS